MICPRIKRKRNMAKTYSSLVHLNGNLLASVDLETTGLQAGYHEPIQIAIVPLNSDIKPLDVRPFYTTIRPNYPERQQTNAGYVHGLKLEDLVLHAPDAGRVQDLMVEWWEKLDLPVGKTLVPLAHNWAFESGFLRAWLGVDLSQQLFHGHARDAMLYALALNDKSAFLGLPAPFPKVGLGSICKKFSIVNPRPHDALCDAMAEAEQHISYCITPAGISLQERYSMGICWRPILIADQFDLGLKVHGGYNRNYTRKIFTMSTVAYLRCSTDSQDTLRQREAIEHSRIKIDHWLEDHQSRDKAHKRPDFQRLLQAVQAGQVDTIVVASLDRFGVKDAYEMGKFFSILRDHNCRLLDATGKHLNADDDATVLTSTIGALTSSREQKEKSYRVLTGKITLARKGNYIGGPVPYGVDVACLDSDGKEKWRCVNEGHDKRVKIYPDGRQERFDGKGNLPRKSLHETLKYRPSLVAERVKYIKQIFKWYTTENVTAGQIAARLNDLGVSPVASPLWHQGVIKHILRNPLYTGKPAYNKQSNSRFMEFSNGQIKTAERKPARRHDKVDQIQPEQNDFPPIV